MCVRVCCARACLLCPNVCSIFADGMVLAIVYNGTEGTHQARFVLADVPIRQRDGQLGAAKAAGVRDVVAVLGAAHGADEVHGYAARWRGCVRAGRCASARGRSRFFLCDSCRFPPMSTADPLYTVPVRGVGAVESHGCRVNISAPLRADDASGQVVLLAAPNASFFGGTLRGSMCALGVCATTSCGKIVVGAPFTWSSAATLSMLAVPADADALLVAAASADGGVLPRDALVLTRDDDGGAHVTGARDAGDSAAASLVLYAQQE